MGLALAISVVSEFAKLLVALVYNACASVTVSRRATRPPAACRWPLAAGRLRKSRGYQISASLPRVHVTMSLSRPAPASHTWETKVRDGMRAAPVAEETISFYLFCSTGLELSLDGRSCPH